MAKTVLIVEDDRNIADLLRLYLEKEGYTVVIAPDGMRGVEQFRTVHPSLVLLDVMLPGLDGWGVCRAIRAESQTPIIMLTAKSETEDKVNGLKQGADDYITKPFEMKEVLARIEAVLRRSGIPLYGAALRPDAMDARQADYSRCALAIGSEGRGLSREVLDLCDKTVLIPMSPRCESLNAAIAAAVLLWESWR